jgi:hypothetical protein
MDEEPDRIPKTLDQGHHLSHQDANLSSSAADLLVDAKGVTVQRRNPAAMGVGKVPETVRSTDFREELHQTINIAGGSRFRTADATVKNSKRERAQEEEEGEKCANLSSSSSPLSPLLS